LSGLVPRATKSPVTTLEFVQKPFDTDIVKAITNLNVTPDPISELARWRFTWTPTQIGETLLQDVTQLNMFCTFFASRTGGSSGQIQTQVTPAGSTNFNNFLGEKATCSSNDATRTERNDTLGSSRFPFVSNPTAQEYDFVIMYATFTNGVTLTHRNYRITASFVLPEGVTVRRISWVV